MEAIVARSIIGYLVQILPCAVLCLLPFRGRFRTSTRRAWLAAAGIMAAGLALFIGVLVGFYVASGGEPSETLKTLQNLIFLADVGALFALYIRVVDAGPAQKTFVFSVAMLYGFFVTFLSSHVSLLMGLAEGSDGFLYHPPRLAVLAAANAVFFLALAPVARSVRRLLAAHVAPGIWWRMAVLPLILVLTLVVGGWLPPLDNSGLFITLSFVLALDSVILVWWMLRMVRLAVEQTNRQAKLERALRERTTAQNALADELRAARERVDELERQMGRDDAPAPTEEAQPIVLATPTRAMSFLPDEVTHVDSLNRVRSIHFANGQSVQIDMTLSAIAEELPGDCFAYCHRSIMVNLNHVRQVTARGVELDTGELLPVSRRRLPELRDAVAKLG